MFDRSSEPGGLSPTGGLSGNHKHRKSTPRSGPGCRDLAPADHSSEPGGLLPTGGLSGNHKPRKSTPRSGPGCRGSAPADHSSEPGGLSPTGGQRTRSETPSLNPAKRREWRLSLPREAEKGCRGLASADHSSEPRHPPWRGGLTGNPKHRKSTLRSRENGGSASRKEDMLR